MPVYLDEQYFGHDTQLIGFPHLLLCMGLVVRTPWALWGVHLTETGATPTTINAFNTWLNDRGYQPGDAYRLYGCCNRSVRYGTNTSNAGRNAWQAEMTTIAGVLGYHGQVAGFDTSIIDPVDGTYVEYRPDNANGCKIFYKRHEKTVRGPVGAVTAHSPTADFVKQNGAGYRSAGLFPPLSIDIIATPSNKGQLHEVDYARRLNTFDIP